MGRKRRGRRVFTDSLNAKLDALDDEATKSVYNAKEDSGVDFLSLYIENEEDVEILNRGITKRRGYAYFFLIACFLTFLCYICGIIFNIF